MLNAGELGRYARERQEKQIDLAWRFVDWALAGAPRRELMVIVREMDRIRPKTRPRAKRGVSKTATDS